MLAYNQKPDISKFTLYVAQGYSINEKAFTNDSEKEYQTIIESDKAVTALVSRVKQIYKDDLTKFKRDYQTICSKSTIERLGDIDELIAEQLITPFHATAADIIKEDKYPLIPFLVIDHISKPFDDKNQKALGAILHGAYTNLQKSEMQIILFDDEDASSLGLTPDHSINLLGEDKSGFNPFYMPSKEDSPNAPEEVE